MLALGVLLLHGPSSAPQTLFFSDYQGALASHFQTLSYFTFLLTYKWGVSTGLRTAGPEKSPLTLIFQLTVTHHVKSKITSPLFCPRQGLVMSSRGQGPTAGSKRQWRQSGNLQPSQGLCNGLPVPASPSTAPSEKQRGEGAGLGCRRSSSEPAASAGCITAVYIVLSCFLFCTAIGNAERGQAAAERPVQPCHEA